MPTLEFPLAEVPFSMRGSWLSVSRVLGLHRSAELIHLVSHQTGMHPVLSFQPIAGGTPVETTEFAAPERLRWASGAGEFTAAFADVDTVRVRGAGLGLRLSDASGGLTPFTGTFLFIAPQDGAAVLTSYETGRRYRVTRLAGEFSVIGAERLGAGERAIEIGADGGEWEIAIEELISEPAPFRPKRSFDDVVAARAAEFAEFADGIAPWRAEHPGAALAAYVLWSATVRPLGFVTREAVLMSKHWMNKVWSWDHCFNALVLASSHPELAIDQFLVVFDHQVATGALPDSITHSEVLYNFVKPPIHGWMWSELRRRLPSPVPADVLLEVYRRLAAWTRYWLDHRRGPGEALPFYEHGNDSGWDNSTVFDLDRVVESPDLAAFLVLQLDELARLADEVAPDAAGGWRMEGELLLGALMSELWDGEQFVARSVAGRRIASTSSLLTALPLIASHRLPGDVSQRLAEKVAAHLTAFGPATELPSSPLYDADGYWRGPIWAPSTIIVEAGLRAAGHHDLADDVSERFRRLCERSGFAENFDALTGAGLRDRAYTWTASAYLLLAGQASERSMVMAEAVTAEMALAEMASESAGGT
ncbi:amylo-alpha-1,6-glucosidase [Agromyces albus]|uniref:amylo-alpha-1,6-glucosidase n=1 Tax=Agromyces albus TaxID=205332 RepID=UPI0027872596|nr:glycogen debranching protein [Agromyces albus]MDQ0574371.1 glycogen debranching enzyme [Agromyces albus]